MVLVLGLRVSVMTFFGASLKVHQIGTTVVVSKATGKLLRPKSTLSKAFLGVALALFSKAFASSKASEGFAKTFSTCFELAKALALALVGLVVQRAAMGVVPLGATGRTCKSHRTGSSFTFSFVEVFIVVVGICNGSISLFSRYFIFVSNFIPLLRPVVLVVLVVVEVARAIIVPILVPGI